MRGSTDAFVVKVATTCAYTLSSSARSFNADGGSNSVNVTTAGDCGWTATSNASWINVTLNRSASGSGSVSVEITPNSTGSGRSGTVTVAGQTFTAVQDGGLGDDCADAVSPAMQSFRAGGGNGTINVQASQRCAWHAVTVASWINITSGSGVGDGSVAYTVAPNPNSSGRSATIAVGKYRVTIKQKAGG
jgi:hypothetical protein